MSITPTAQLAGLVASLRFGDLPPDVVHQAGRVVLDALGCAIAAHAEDPAKATRARQLVAGFHATGPASVIGGGLSDPALAPLANGILINATDYDDTHKRALIHVGSVVVPAALAVTEQTGGSGRDLITALVAGYEVAARVGVWVLTVDFAMTGVAEEHYDGAASRGRIPPARSLGSRLRTRDVRPCQ